MFPRRAHALALLALLACHGALAAPRPPSRETLVAVAADQKAAADAEWALRDRKEAELEAARSALEKARKAETPEEREEREEKEEEEREKEERALKKRAAAARAAAAAAPAPALIEGGPDGDDDWKAKPATEAPSAAPQAAPGPAPSRRAPRLRASDMLGSAFPGPFRGMNASVSAPYVTPTPAGGPPAGTKANLDAVLTEDYDPAVGGRGLRKGTARAESDVARRALNKDDVMSEEGENDRPKRVIKTAIDTANAFGARPGDVPVVAPTPLADAHAARPATQLDASRLVLPANDTLWAFAATGSVDQPSRRFRPPDQSLCVGGGVAITGNNLVLRTWNASTGDPLQGPTSPQDFFGVSGDMSDPVCIFDAPGSRRFYLAIFAYADAPIKKSEFVVAVSKTENPADGWLGPYIVRNDGLDARGDPLPGLESCALTPPRQPGCLGDYPSMGMDEHTLVTGFNLFGDGYAGVLVLALSKADLLSGRHSRPAAAAYTNWPPDLSYTVHPTATQAGTPHDTERGGTLWIASTGPATQNDPNVPALAVWAITNTSSLASPTFPADGVPIVHPPALLATPAYRDPAAADPPVALTQPSPGTPLDTGDGRTLQSVYSGGLIWAASQTVVRVGDASAQPTIGTIYFAVEPSWRGATFTPRLVATGYAALEKTHLARPAITATPGGTAFIGVLATGENVNPTQAVVEVDLISGPVAVRIPAYSPSILYPLSPDELIEPKSDNKGYLRGGDYGAACLDDSGAAWTAGEWSGGVPSAACVAKDGKERCPSWSTLVVRSRVSGDAGEFKAAVGGAAVDRVSIALAGGRLPAVGRYGGAPVRADDTPKWLKNGVSRAEEDEEEDEREEREEKEERRERARRAARDDDDRD